MNAIRAEGTYRMFTEGEKREQRWRAHATGEVRAETSHESPRFVFRISPLFYWRAARRCQRLAVKYVSSRVTRTDLHRLAGSDPASAVDPSSDSGPSGSGRVTSVEVVSARSQASGNILMLWAWHRWSARQ